MLAEINYHHIGIYVTDLEKNIKFYETVFDMIISLRKQAKFIKEYENLQIVFLKNNIFTIELIGSVKNTVSVNKIHIALSVTNILAFISKLEVNNIEYEKILLDNGDIDFIRFVDPESNMFEIFRKQF